MRELNRQILTNEKFRTKFSSQFDLVNYAIKLTENMIRSGRQPRVKTDVQNPALHALEEIYEGKDQIDDISEMPPKEVHQVIHNIQEETASENIKKKSLRPLEKKKTRKIISNAR